MRSGTAEEKEEVRQALETLFRAYWLPLYCIARQKRLAVFSRLLHER